MRETLGFWAVVVVAEGTDCPFLSPAIGAVGGDARLPPWPQREREGERAWGEREEGNANGREREKGSRVSPGPTSSPLLFVNFPFFSAQLTSFN